jgi:RNA polymerase sigma-70 factor (ECF subfamily)
VQNDDDKLIAECLQGETNAFGRLVTRYQDRLYHSLSSMLGSTEEARDVAQDAFVHAFQKLHTFRGQSAFYSWLFRIALNAAANRHRKEHRRAVSIDAARDQSGIEPRDPHPASYPGFALEVSERQALVRGALAELSPEHRTVLILKEIEGLSYEEIAAIVDCPVGTVRSRIHRGRLDLRARLEALFREPSEK